MEKEPQFELNLIGDSMPDPKALAEKVRGRTSNLRNNQEVNSIVFAVLDEEGVTDKEKRYLLMAEIYSELEKGKKTASQGGLSSQTISRADKAHENGWLYKHERNQDERDSA